MAFDYEIRADGTAALATSDKVIDSLVAIEGEAKKVGTSLSSSFSTPAVKNAQGQFVATGVAAQQLAEKVKLAAASSTDLNAKLRAEHEMLERIHGPMKRFEQDMAALEALHKRGAVTAAEYARELARIGAAAGMSRGNPADAVSLTMPTAANSNGGAIAGQIAGMVGPAALAATAIKGVTDELTRWGDRRRDIEAASNSVLRFHDTMAQAQGAMQEQRELADDLHLNIRKTTEAYAAVREATAEYGLTSQQQVDITRNLTSAVINDGGAIEDVTAIMARFQMAQENGGMSSKELTAIWKKSDDVATLMGEALGLTWPQMQKLAKEGKFTSEMVAEMVGKLGLGDSSMRKYSERALDVNEVQKELNVSFMEAVRITLEATAVELACEHMSDEDIDALQEVWDPERLENEIDMEEIKAREEAFHIGIAIGSGNTILANYLRDINNHIRILRRLGFPDRQAVIETCDEHYAICQLIREHNKTQARRAMMKHIRKSQELARSVTLSQLQQAIKRHQVIPNIDV